MTTRTGVIGYPVKHSLSPAMHNAAYAHLGLDWNYTAIELEIDSAQTEVIDIFEGGCAGLNVTMPFKEMAYDLTTTHGPASRLRSVNTIIPDTDGALHGYSTDGQGFVNSLLEQNVDIKGSEILVIGAGGASRAICDGLVHFGAEVFVTARKIDKSLELIEAIISNKKESDGSIDVIDWSERETASANCNVIINATPVGMTINSKQDSSLPIAVDQFDKSAIVVDTIYYPTSTELLKQARQHGCGTINGLEMLIHQGALAFSLMTGQDAPIDVMRKAVDDQLKEKTDEHL